MISDYTDDEPKGLWGKKHIEDTKQMLLNIAASFNLAQNLICNFSVIFGCLVTLRGLTGRPRLQREQNMVNVDI